MAQVSDILIDALSNAKLQYTFEDVDTIPQEDDECFICKERYRNAADDSAELRCDPIRLTCGHLVGKQCFDAWRAHSGQVERCMVCNQHLLTLAMGRAESLLYYVSTSSWFKSQEGETMYLTSKIFGPVTYITEILSVQPVASDVLIRGLSQHISLLFAVHTLQWVCFMAASRWLIGVPEPLLYPTYSPSALPFLLWLDCFILLHYRHFFYSWSLKCLVLGVVCAWVRLGFAMVFGFPSTGEIIFCFADPILYSIIYLGVIWYARLLAQRRDIMKKRS